MEIQLKIKLFVPEQYDENYFKAFLLTLVVIKRFKEMKRDLELIDYALIVLSSLEKVGCNSFENFESIMYTLAAQEIDDNERKYVEVEFDLNEMSLAIKDKKYFAARLNQN